MSFYLLVLSKLHISHGKYIVQKLAERGGGYSYWAHIFYPFLLAGSDQPDV